MKKILLTEDEKYLIEIYETKLKQAGYEVTVDETGEKTFELAAGKKPDLILLDLLLPKADGFELIKRLKKSPATKKLLVYALSNLGQNGEIKKGLEFGADGYLVKSDLTPAQLVADVGRIFNGEKVGREMPEE